MSLVVVKILRSQAQLTKICRNYKLVSKLCSLEEQGYLKEKYVNV